MNENQNPDADESKPFRLKDAIFIDEEDVKPPKSKSPSTPKPPTPLPLPPDIDPRSSSDFSTTLPPDSIRYGLQEANFHRFEQYIKLVLEHGTYHVTERQLFDLSMKPSTFQNKFTDAILGFRRFHYRPTDVTIDKVLLEKSAQYITARKNQLNGVNLRDSSYTRRSLLDPGSFILPQDLARLEQSIQSDLFGTGEGQVLGKIHLSSMDDVRTIEELRAKYRKMIDIEGMTAFIF